MFIEVLYEFHSMQKCFRTHFRFVGALSSIRSFVRIVTNESVCVCVCLWHLHRIYMKAFTPTSCCVVSMSWNIIFKQLTLNTIGNRMTYMCFTLPYIWIVFWSGHMLLLGIDEYLRRLNHTDRHSGHTNQPIRLPREVNKRKRTHKIERVHKDDLKKIRCFTFVEIRMRGIYRNLMTKYNGNRPLSTKDLGSPINSMAVFKTGERSRAFKSKAPKQEKRRMEKNHNFNLSHGPLQWLNESMKLKVAITDQTNGNVLTRTVFIDALHMNARLLLEPTDRPTGRLLCIDHIHIYKHQFNENLFNLLRWIFPAGLFSFHFILRFSPSRYWSS